MNRPHAVIAGAGLGGLAAAASLCRQGWSVTVYERAAELQPVGSGLAIAANGLRALDTLGVGAQVRALAGVNSVLRRSLFPDHPGPRYSGYTAWRMLVPKTAEILPGETWGRGRVFGITPLADGRIYAYAAIRAPKDVTHADERAELLSLFGDWHAPIPALIASAEPETILHNDVYEMATPLPAYHRGRVAILGDAAHAMTPHLGQGACQAIEDAVTLGALMSGKTPGEVPIALNTYTDIRRPRGIDIVRRSRRVGALTQAASKPKTAMRDVLIRVVGKISPDAVLRSMDPVVNWQPLQVEADETARVLPRE